MAETLPPVVVDLGRQNRRRIRDLKKREGPLMHDVAHTVSELRASSPELADKELVPVVFIYQKKLRGRVASGLLRGVMPCCGKTIPGCSCR
jgi:hypothetical protein